MEFESKRTSRSSSGMIVKGDNNKFSRGLQGKAENSSIRRLSREHGYTLYVQNIPQAMQWKDQYQAGEVGVGQLPGSNSALPATSSAQVADAGTCQQSGPLSDPNQAPKPN
ncbi:hypothetical protein V6N12_027699 [Hibiscus sabdariffa]|uniref:Uncharacterized protein n=1 Tax=Hibiscus sabdariffa TaxID=183260 RepID=A0ABR2F3Q0_9ROSI